MKISGLGSVGEDFGFRVQGRTFKTAASMDATTLRSMVMILSKLDVSITCHHYCYYDTF